MIELTKMNNERFFLNPNLVEMMETTPDTLITMTSGKKYYVLESVDEVKKRFLEFYVIVNSRGRRSKLPGSAQE